MMSSTASYLRHSCETRPSSYLVASINSLGDAVRMMQRSGDLNSDAASQLLGLVRDTQQSTSISEQRTHLQALRHETVRVGGIYASTADLLSQIDVAIRTLDANLRQCIQDGSTSLDQPSQGSKAPATAGSAQ
jgi:hypothetical protein